MVKKPFKRGSEEKPAIDSDKYIDLGSLTFDDEHMAVGARMNVKVAELHRYEDLGDLTNMVYGGDILILDFTPISNDRLTLRRVTNELKSVARDIGGDVAGISKSFLIVCPEGVKVDRNKIRGPY